MALCKPAATELKSKNAHGLSRMFHHGVFYTDPFFDFFFLIYILIFFLIVPWQDKGILDGFCK